MSYVGFISFELGNVGLCSLDMVWFGNWLGCLNFCELCSFRYVWVRLT